jgi:hypothetical protein
VSGGMFASAMMSCNGGSEAVDVLALSVTFVDDLAG